MGRGCAERGRGDARDGLLELHRGGGRRRGERDGEGVAVGGCERRGAAAGDAAGEVVHGQRRDGGVGGCRTARAGTRGGAPRAVARRRRRREGRG